MSDPRIAYLDIETAPIIAAVWTLYEANAVWTLRETFILSFAYKWAGEKQVITKCLPDYPGYKKNKTSDYRLCEDLHHIYDEADIVIAHNGDSFDHKKVAARLAMHGFDPPSPYKSIDTLKLARKHFKFDSNKLDHVARYLGIGRKLPHAGADLWRDCEAGDPKAWDLMRRYNSHDVLLLEGVHKKLEGWGNTPDLRPFSGREGCPTCLSNHVQQRGYMVARTKRYPRFQCMKCGKWFSGKKAA